MYEKFKPFHHHPDFSHTVRLTKDHHVYDPIYKSFLKMVRSDNKQILRVLVAYYRQKIESLFYNIANENIKSNAILSASSVVEMEELLRCDLNEKKICEFCYFVDRICYSNIMNHFQSWHDPSLHLMYTSIIEQLIDIFKSIFPLTHSIMMISTCATECCSPSQCDRQAIIKNELS